MAKNGSGKGSRKGRGAKPKKTVDKADVVEVREGELELKPIEVDDRSFDMHFKGVKAAKEMMEKYQSAYRSALNSAKKVSVDLWNCVKDAIKLESKDPYEVKRELEIRGYVLKRQGSPIQIVIHDTILGDVNEAAFKRGLNDGENGKGNANPYPVGSDLAERYDMGHTEGQTKLINKGQPAEGTNSGAPLPLN